MFPSSSGHPTAKPVSEHHSQVHLFELLLAHAPALALELAVGAVGQGADLVLHPLKLPPQLRLRLHQAPHGQLRLQGDSPLQGCRLLHVSLSVRRQAEFHPDKRNDCLVGTAAKNVKQRVRMAASPAPPPGATWPAASSGTPAAPGLPAPACRFWARNDKLKSAQTSAVTRHSWKETKGIENGSCLRLH